jgi:hypothetical protein
MPDNLPPRPYLSKAEVTERLTELGFITGPDVLNYPPGFQTRRFKALEELIAGAIAEWADVEPSDDIRIDQVNQELLEWAEEWMVEAPEDDPSLPPILRMEVDRG